MSISDTDISALWITLKLASVTTVLLLLVGTPLAWWLANSKNRFKFIVEAIVGLPLILPPTVLGFYLLVGLGSQSTLGNLFESITGSPFAFSFYGLILGSMIYSMPFVIQPLQNTFSSIGQGPLEAASTLRASPIDRFFSVVLPLSRHGFLTATVLGFAHTIGEFGVVLMVGGNIPGKTRVLSIAIYDHVEALEYEKAHTLSAALLILSFALLLLVYAVNRKTSLRKT